MYVIKLPNGNLLVPESATVTLNGEAEAAGGTAGTSRSWSTGSGPRT